MVRLENDDALHHGQGSLSPKISPKPPETIITEDVVTEENPVGDIIANRRAQECYHIDSQKKIDTSHFVRRSTRVTTHGKIDIQSLQSDECLSKLNKNKNCRTSQKRIHGVQNFLTHAEATECVESIADCTRGNPELEHFVNTYFDPDLVKTELHRLVLAGTVLRRKSKLISNPSKVEAPRRIQDAFIAFHGDIIGKENGKKHAMLIDITRLFTLRDDEMNGETICGSSKSMPTLSIVEDRMSHSDVAELYSKNEQVKLPINGRSSVLLHVDVPDNILTPVLDEIDNNLLPRASDTPQSLTDQISKSSYLDEMSSYTSAASPSKLIRQNSQVKWNQPKRRSTSLVVRKKHVYKGSDGEGYGEEVMTLFNYTSYGRYPDDWRGRPMTCNVAILNVYLWIQCWSYLTHQSRRSPPTHVQALFYYGALGVKRRNSPAHGTNTHGSGMNQH